MGSICARSGRSGLFGVLERFGAAGGGVNKIQHRLEIGIVAGLNNLPAQPFYFTGDIGRKMLLSCARRSHFSRKLFFPLIPPDFSTFRASSARPDAVIEMNALIKTLVHVCVSRQNQEFTVWVSDSDWTTAAGRIVARSLLFSATVLASVARR